MSNKPVELSHQELSLLVFALEGGPLGAAARDDGPPSCEAACPVVEHFEALFDGADIPAEKQLLNHLGNHLREALIDSGMFELMATAQGPGAPGPPSVEDQMRLRQVNERLSAWKCEINLEPADGRLLSEALGRLPRSAWISMPRLLWRLRKKLKSF